MVGIPSVGGRDGIRPRVDLVAPVAQGRRAGDNAPSPVTVADPPEWVVPSYVNEPPVAAVMDVALSIVIVHRRGDRHLEPEHRPEDEKDVGRPSSRSRRSRSRRRQPEACWSPRDHLEDEADDSADRARRGPSAATRPRGNADGRRTRAGRHRADGVARDDGVPQPIEASTLRLPHPGVVRASGGRSRRRRRR